MGFICEREKHCPIPLDVCTGVTGCDTSSACGAFSEGPDDSARPACPQPFGHNRSLTRAASEGFLTSLTPARKARKAGTAGIGGRAGQGIPRALGRTPHRSPVLPKCTLTWSRILKMLLVVPERTERLTAQPAIPPEVSHSLRLPATTTSCVTRDQDVVTRHSRGARTASRVLESTRCPRSPARRLGTRACPHR